MSKELSSELLKRIVRYKDLVPQKLSYVITRTEGSTEEETFSVIGRGTIENMTDRHIHMDFPHGFNMGGARMPPGAVNQQHSHTTAEVFLVHKGNWTFTLGPNKEDGTIEVGVGDLISIPTLVFRGFYNSGANIGHLVSILGEDDPGRVTWAPYVFDAVEGSGLLLLENGTLVDTVAGEKVPEGAKLTKPTTVADLPRFRRVTATDMRSWYVRLNELQPCPTAPLTRDGVEECLVIGIANEAENVPAAPISTPHGFQVRRIRMIPGASVPAHARNEVEVLFVHSGGVQIEIGGNVVQLGTGDYFSIPAGMFRAWKNTGSEKNDIQVVRGGDKPAAPVWQT